VDSVQRPQRGWEGVGRATEHGRGHVDAVHALEESQHEPTPIRQVFRIEKPLPQPPIERAEALDFRERAGHGLLNARPLRQAVQVHTKM
jgi:hypothetical protein